MSTKTPVQVAGAAKELEVEGGPAGRIRVLFEVCSSFNHHELNVYMCSYIICQALEAEAYVSSLRCAHQTLH